MGGQKVNPKDAKSMRGEEKNAIIVEQSESNSQSGASCSVIYGTLNEPYLN